MKELSSVIISVVLLVMVRLSPFGQTNVYSEETQTLFINEVMASNQTAIHGGDVKKLSEISNGGAYSDWIEIYNASSMSVDLTGYTISDAYATWEFPGGIVPAKGFLLIRASDKNKFEKDGQLYMSFIISSSSEVLTLKKPDGTIIDTVTASGLEKNISLARKIDGGLEFAVFSQATPGKSNASGTILQSPVPEPAFSRASGFYSTAFY